MKKLITLLLVTLCGVSIAGEKIDQSLDAAIDGIVEIHNVRGEVSVNGWDQAQVRVSGLVDDMAEEFIFESKGQKTLIKVKLPRNTGFGFHNRDGSQLSIQVPKGSKVVFTGVATDLDMALIENGIDINSVSGDIVIKNSKGRTYINSVSGDLKVDELNGSLEVSTVSGDLEARGDINQVNVTSVSADVSVKCQKLNSASMSNVSGDTHLYGQLDSQGELKLSSVSGEAYFFINGDLDAQVSIETAPGGDIVNEYSTDKAKSSFINSHSLRFTAGAGEGSIRMSTVSGDIGLKRN